VRADAYYHFRAGTGWSGGRRTEAVQAGRLALAADEPLHDPDVQRRRAAARRSIIVSTVVS
jgi:hypothetical protein